MFKAKIFPAWQYRDPHEILERLMMTPVKVRTSALAPARTAKDRYYTAWRRCCIRKVMRAKR